MPAQSMELMRHESIDTTLRYDVGTDARAKAEAAWAASEQGAFAVFSGRLPDSGPSEPPTAGAEHHVAASTSGKWGRWDSNPGPTD